MGKKKNKGMKNARMEPHTTKGKHNTHKSMLHAALRYATNTGKAQ